ncbi:iron-containing alcohol dehydrogenase [Shewanella waksmanii]|uniref:iron-containing alcohol dehydrogenase n=1 Tax=Shewanella waksmanii TaxID=213783 RepID=UPI0004901F07|nr:iron-containing alcohol dehydrogenase [Shewanella waksmanii]
MQNTIGKLNTRQLEFPAQLIVRQNAVAASSELLEQLSTNKVVIALDEGVRQLAQQSLAFLDQRNLITHAISAADFENISQIDMLCAQQQVDTVIAFGGGKVLDACKRLASLRNVKLVVIPTALSSDCISSPVAVIFDKEGKKLSLPAAIPNFIIVDTDICARAPTRLTQAGVGDLLSNYSALLDMEYAEKQAEIDGFSFLLAKSAANEILYMGSKSLDDPEIINQLAEGLILSGLAMGFSGDSRPCSGAEHLISHALDFLQLGHGLHGEQVALGTKYCHYLRKLLGLPSLNPQVITTLDGLNIQSSPAALGISREDFFKALEIAPSMRKGRITFLEQLAHIPQATLQQAYADAFEPLTQ